MDWLNPSDDQRVILAVIRRPAKNKDDYRGPAIVNPGVRSYEPFKSNGWS
jgi:hypothetical protein